MSKDKNWTEPNGRMNSSRGLNSHEKYMLEIAKLDLAKPTPHIPANGMDYESQSANLRKNLIQDLSFRKQADIEGKVI